MGTDRPDLAAARELVQTARGVVILTGAGVSAESGIPTFRAPGGLWGRNRPEDLATPEAFSRDPVAVWSWYESRRRAVLECAPNDGHRAIARFLVSRDDVTLVTQNVDGLHQRARDEVADVGGRLPGRSARVLPPEADRIVELHGNLLRSRCSQCGWIVETPEPVEARSEGTLPRCADCGALMRPDVVWFGEMLPRRALSLAFESAATAEVCIVVGTSAVVHPAAAIPLATRDSGGAIIEVNPESTALTPLAAPSLRGSAGDVLPAILDPRDMIG